MFTMFVLNSPNTIGNSGTGNNQNRNNFIDNLNSLENPLRQFGSESPPASGGNTPGIGGGTTNNPSSTGEKTIEELEKEIAKLRQELQNTQQPYQQQTPQISPAQAEYMQALGAENFISWLNGNFYGGMYELMKESLFTTAPIHYIQNHPFFQLMVKAVGAFQNRETDINMYKSGAIYLANLAKQLSIPYNTIPNLGARIKPFNVSGDMDFFGRDIIDTRDLAIVVSNAHIYDGHNLVFNVPGIPMSVFV